MGEQTPLERALGLLRDYIFAAGGDVDDEADLEMAEAELKALYRLA